MSKRFNFGGIFGSKRVTGGFSTGGYLGQKDPGIYSLRALAGLHKRWSKPAVDAFDFYLTSAGAAQTTTLQTGPTTAQITSQSVSGGTLGGSNGYQEWTAPATGDYRFTLEGARGGVSIATTASRAAITGWNHFSPVSNPSQKRCARGAKVTGVYSLNAGDVITIVVGQHGADDPGNGQNPSGGGGTFVALGTRAQVQQSSDTLLFAAGGAGGYSGDGGSDNYTTGEGQSTTTNSGSNSGGNGTAGNGAVQTTTSNNSSGGGGYNTNSGSGTASNFTDSELTGFVAYGFRRGAHGGEHTAGTNDQGGFGGGGAGSAQTGTDDDKGGGGGYSGGAYAFDAFSFGGGGGSYAIGTATSTTLTRGGAQYNNGATGVSEGNGSVYIEFGFQEKINGAESSWSTFWK